MRQNVDKAKAVAALSWWCLKVTVQAWKERRMCTQTEASKEVMNLSSICSRGRRQLAAAENMIGEKGRRQSDRYSQVQLKTIESNLGAQFMCLAEMNLCKPCRTTLSPHSLAAKPVNSAAPGLQSAILLATVAAVRRGALTIVVVGRAVGVGVVV